MTSGHDIMAAKHVIRMGPPTVDGHGGRRVYLIILQVKELTGLIFTVASS